MTEPKAIIKDGKVVNAEQLKRYYRDKRERDYFIQRGAYQDKAYEKLYSDVPIETTDKRARLKPDVPWAKEQWQSVQQLRAMVNHLNNKITELRAVKKKTQQDYEPF